MSENRKFEVVAGSVYGSKVCEYELVNDRLVLLDQSDGGNLMNNCYAARLEGLSIDEAIAKVREWDSKPVGHEYDGCHLCRWSISIREI